jgi:hypothetical protein
MKLEKITVALAVTLFFIAASHKALAATTNVNVTVNTDAQNNKMAVKTIKKKSVSKAVVKKPATAKQKAMAQAKKKQVTKKSIDNEIEKEIRAFELAAVANPVKTDAVLSDMQKGTTQKTGLGVTSVTSTKIETVKEAVQPPVFSGSVNFTFGKDSNIDPDKTDIKGNFYQIEPTLTFKSGGWSGTMGATIKDFTEQQQSNIFKQNEAKADFAYTTKLTNVVTSTTTIAALYHDEKWPDYINGPDINGVDAGMPIRYGEFSLAQNMAFNSGRLTTEVGGKAMKRDAYSMYSDFAPDVFEEKLYEKDFTELSANGKIAVAAADFLDISLNPLVKQTKYDEREGRQPGGFVGGLTLTAPKYELMTSEVALKADLKFGGSTITPEALVGQVSDESLGAEDRSYYGYGISSSIVLNEGLKLTITPNIKYKKINYDSWKNYVDGNDPMTWIGPNIRVDDETSMGIDASMMITSNFGAKVSYSHVEENSNMKIITDENYTQEIISSSLIFAF